MIGILCEKPSAQRNFAKALGANSSFKGSYNGESFVIAAARGHLYEFEDPKTQVDPTLASKYGTWNLANLPWDEKDVRWKYRKNSDAAPTLKAIEATLRGCDELVIACDVDPSGEGFLLGAEIMLGLKLRPKKFSRMYFADEAPASIQKAFCNRKVVPNLVQDREYLMAYYRARWDWLSMQWTRVATICAGMRFGDGQLRQGRLKSAMVQIVGDGLKALADYKPVPFYSNKFKDENGVIYTSKKEPTFDSKDKVPQNYLPSSVTKDGAKMMRTPPPKLIDLATLSARLATKGLKSKQVLATYQKMYESQVVSYPRTEDKVITPEQFNELLPKVDAIAALVGVDKRLLTHRTPRSTHVKSGGAHGANRPGPNVPKSLDDLVQYGPGAKEIYILLAHNYLAMLAEDYEYESQKGHIAKYPDFVGSAQVPKKMGWKQVFDEDAEPPEDENAKGIGAQASPFIAEGVNKKPPTPTMKWLMAQLEKHDVGTGATRTSTYADVTGDPKCPLLADTRGKITMTQFGEMSYRLLPGTHIGDLKLTESLEADMRDVADGKKSPDACLHEVQQLVRDDIDVMKQNAVSMKATMGIVTASVDDAERYDGTWKGQKVSFIRNYFGHRFTDDECRDLCAGKEIKVLDAKGSKGTFACKGSLGTKTAKSGKTYVTFIASAYLNSDGSERQQTPAGDYVVGKWKGKQVRFKRTFSGHTFTDKEIAELLDGKEISFEAVSVKTGSTYTARGKLANQTYNGVKYVGFALNKFK